MAWEHGRVDAKYIIIIRINRSSSEPSKRTANIQVTLIVLYFTNLYLEKGATKNLQLVFQHCC